MDILSLLRTLGALGLVLGGLTGALWAVRRYDIKLPGRVATGPRRRRVEMVERISLDGKRSLALIRRDDAEHLILLSPDGHLAIETGIVRVPEASFVASLDLADIDAATPKQPEAAAVAAPAVAPVAAPAAAPAPVPAPQNDNLAVARQGFAALVERARDRLQATA